jgi:CHASE2 domain-containing sensor protein
MTAKHKNKAPNRPAEGPAGSQASHGPSQASSEESPHGAPRGATRLDIWASFGLSLLFTFILIAVNWRVEDTDFGRRLESMTYDFLQQHLSTSATPQNTPQVLDISGIQMRPTLGREPAQVTDRPPLKDLVNSLAARPLKQRPYAIGLDVDFSPDSHGYADPEDPDLLSALKNLNDMVVPVRVGVNRSLALGPKKWLLNEDYIDLASCVIVPKPDPAQSAQYMPEWIDVAYNSADPPNHCESMGVALVNARYGRDIPSYAGWMVESYRPRADKGVSQREFLVDYSLLDSLIGSTVDALDSAKLAATDVSNRIVLLGRTRDTTDMFTVPGRPEKSYPGVYLHACAALTLLETRPLYRLKPAGRIFLDMVFSILVFGPLLVHRLRRSYRGETVVIGHRASGILSFLAALVLVLIAVGFVRWTHLMWDDFILVGAALLVHTPFEHNSVELVESAWSALRSRKPPASPSHSGAE